MRLARIRGLDTEHARDARTDRGHVQRAEVSSDTSRPASHEQQQAQAALLRQRLAAGHADVAHAVADDFGDDVVDLAPFPAVEGIGGVAVAAAQRAAGQARTNTLGQPAAAASPRSDRKISVIFSRSSGD